ncbi:hypothetical protein [Streptomyces sp. H27-C3]|uniref:hypothetical protein n=1 Tax=Streptomyces sp. H27-C3 TaxID=3046305 RepID=UPI0024B87AF1|nr:hypothetical protein [Streptomyces sp. H27-C3]MDJ0460429.1 hypothetical protein [Streptomyces sp. H27-C3]
MAPGADLCVIVRWHPDAAFRRDSRTRRIPPGAQEHWADRVEAVVTALESIGYRAAVTGPARAPHLHTAEEILVWRLAQGEDRTWPPAGAWDGVEATCRANLGRGYASLEPDPYELVDAVLTTARRGDSGQGMWTVVALDADPVIWPPFAETCARVLWQPDPPFRRLPDGTLPAGAEDHWRTGIARVRQDLEAGGYCVREAERTHSPDLDDDAGLLVWRTRAVDAP